MQQQRSQARVRSSAGFALAAGIVMLAGAGSDIAAQSSTPSATPPSTT